MVWVEVLGSHIFILISIKHVSKHEIDTNNSKIIVVKTTILQILVSNVVFIKKILKYFKIKKQSILKSNCLFHVQNVSGWIYQGKKNIQSFTKWVAKTKLGVHFFFLLVDGVMN